MTHLPPLIGGLHLSKREAHSPAFRHSRYARFPLRGIGISSSRKSDAMLQPSHSHDSLLKGDAYRSISKSNPLRGLKFGKISSHICMCLESLNRIPKSLFKDLLKVIPFGDKVLVCFHIGISFSSLMKKEYTMKTNTINTIDNEPINSVRRIGMLENRVMVQSLRVMEAFGMPSSMARFVLNNVCRVIANDHIEPTTYASLWAFQNTDPSVFVEHSEPSDLNMATRSECQTEPTNGGI